METELYNGFMEGVYERGNLQSFFEDYDNAELLISASSIPRSDTFPLDIYFVGPDHRNALFIADMTIRSAFQRINLKARGTGTTINKVKEALFKRHTELLRAELEEEKKSLEEKISTLEDN